jgi:serine/threonine protein kinase
MNATVDLDLSGRRLSHYVILKPIGAGGMGTVFLARDDRLRRLVAVKVLSGESGEPRHARGLLVEARLLSQLVHPSVAAIYDFLQDGDREYIVMEFVPGATLREVLAAGPLPAEEVVRLGLQLGKGVAAAHAVRVIHRDLKPQNIKLTTGGRLKILDFGVASKLPPPSMLDNSSTESVHGGGTFPYMSPEQLRGEDLDERSDIFSVGALLYEMATGRPAFPQRNLAELVDAILYRTPPLPSAVNPFVPRPLERVVSKALEKDPRARQQRARTLVAELRALRFTRRAGPVSGVDPRAALARALCAVPG